MRSAEFSSMPSPALPAPAGRSCRAGNRRQKGWRAETWGREAELSVARRYAQRGAVLLAHRKRTTAGELDLVFDEGGVLVIVEVKARRSAEDALMAVSSAQWRRIELGAEICADELGYSDLRIDVAAMDGGGKIRIIENASMQRAFC